MIALSQIRSAPGGKWIGVAIAGDQNHSMGNPDFVQPLLRPGNHGRQIKQDGLRGRFRLAHAAVHVPEAPPMSKTHWILPGLISAINGCCRGKKGRLLNRGSL